MAHKYGDLQAMLSKFSEASKQFGLTNSLGKMEVPFTPQPRITIDGTVLKTVNIEASDILEVWSLTKLPLTNATM